MGNRFVKQDTLDGLVVSLCRDFDRRERALCKNDVSHRTKVELKYINYKISEAAREVAGEEYAVYIKEIGREIGYAKTEISEISEAAYKLKKAEIKANIARRLHLTD